MEFVNRQRLNAIESKFANVAQLVVQIPERRPGTIQTVMAPRKRADVHAVPRRGKNIPRPSMWHLTGTDFSCDSTPLSLRTNPTFPRSPALDFYPWTR